MNDRIVVVFIGSEIDAEIEMERFALKEFEQRKFDYQGESGNVYSGRTPYQKYRNHIHWSIRTVELLISSAVQFGNFRGRA